MSRYRRNLRVVRAAKVAATAVPRVTKVVTNEIKVFVVKQHHHDDSTCSESFSEVEHVLDSEIAAIKVCIFENIVENTHYFDYSRDLSPTFVTALKKKFPARIIEIFGEEGVEEDGEEKGDEDDKEDEDYTDVPFTDSEIKETISELSFTKLGIIFSELSTSIAQREEPEYTGMPTQYLFTYHERIIRRDNGD